MAAEIVNLRQARKRAAKRQDEKQAEDNRIRFGTPKALGKRAASEKERAARLLEGHRLDRDERNTARSRPNDDDAGSGE
ncbi:DUF4169 family protein [Consotaella aegiceratis]|uniref:DUF4169 family protein n=1 Tax=Consotaella aegiceratis TaxID=3097961 RepID=UPI002F42A4E3